MLNIINDIGGGEQNLGGEVAQRDVQQQRIVVKPGQVADMGLGGDGGEDHQVAGPDQRLGTVVDGDLAGGVGLFQVAGEARCAVGGQVMHPDLIERPTGAGQEGVDVAGDQTRPDEPDAGRAWSAAAQPVSRQCRRGGGSGGADDRCLQAGERIPGVMIIQDQHRRRPRDPGRHILRETGNPLQPIHPGWSADRGRQRNDPRRRTVGETQKIRRRVHRIPGTMQPVGGLDQLHDLFFLSLQRTLDLRTGDHRERGHGCLFGPFGRGRS